MNCLPLTKHLKRFGQILSKMLPSSSKSSGYQPLSTSDKENTQIDHENSSYFPSNGSTPSTSPDRYKCMEDNWWKPFEVLPTRDMNNNDTYATSRTYLNSSPDSTAFMSPFMSSASSGYNSSYNQKIHLMSGNYDGFKVFQDHSSFESLMSPLLSFSSSAEDSSHTASQPKPYSPVRYNLSDLWFDTEFEEITSIGDSSTVLSQEFDDLRLDFEMNGITTELDKLFSPTVSSTPMTTRKSLPLRDVSMNRAAEPRAEQPLRYFNNNNHINHQRKKKAKPDKKSLGDHCVFCKNNGLDPEKYMSHTVKDRHGRVSCPKLRLYKCPICGDTGDKSHTVKYCPKKPIITLEDLERMGNERKEKHRKRT